MKAHKFQLQLAAFLSIMLASIGLYFVKLPGAEPVSFALLGLITLGMLVTLVVP